MARNMMSLPSASRNALTDVDIAIFVAETSFGDKVLLFERGDTVVLDGSMQPLLLSFFKRATACGRGLWPRLSMFRVPY